jgi:hypothetical protein
LGLAGSLALGSDADNVRIDPRTGNAIVGYGSGGLAIIDPEKRSKRRYQLCIRTAPNDATSGRSQRADADNHRC